MKKENSHGGYRAGAGRKSRQEKGLEETITLTTKVEKSVAEDCKRIFGSVASALRFAAKHIPQEEIKKPG